MQKLDNLLNSDYQNPKKQESHIDEHKYLSQTQEAYYNPPKNLSEFQSTFTLQNQGTPYISFPKEKRFFQTGQQNLKHYYPQESTLIKMKRNFGSGKKYNFGVHPRQLNPLLETPPPTLYNPKTPSSIEKQLGKFSYSNAKIQKRYCADYLLPSIELAFFKEGPSPLDYQAQIAASNNAKPKYHFGEKGKMFNQNQAIAPNSEYQYFSTLTKKTRYENNSITFGKGGRSKLLVCQNKNPGPAAYQSFDEISHFSKYNPKQSGLKLMTQIGKIQKQKEYSKKLSEEHQIKYSIGSPLNNKRYILQQFSQ